MMRHSSARRRRSSEQGYALMLVLFLGALLALAAITAAPNALTDGRREKEQEMIWRGQQYARAIRLYYQKTHKFPTELEDLYKAKTGIRFLRQAYKDPLNSADGSWRLIYVGPNGQLIGSLRRHPMPLNFGGLAPVPPGGPVASSGTAPGSLFGAAGNSQSLGSTGGSTGAPSAPGQNLVSGTASTGQPAAGSATEPDGQNPGASEDLMSTPQSLDASQDATIVGGNIIGVGSKVNRRSIIWYDKARNYRLFEFIWDPAVDAVTGQRLGQIPQNPSLFGSGTNTTAPNPPTSTPGNPVTNPGSGEPPLQAPPNP